MKAVLSLLAVACLTLVIVAGCGPKAQPPAPAAPAAEVPLGEQIFTTGIGASGQHVAFEKGSTQFRAKPGGCANCHGADGKGKKLPQGKEVPAIKTPQGEEVPPICYSDLCQAMGGKPAMYEEKALATPIIKGLNEDGKPLSDVMPRWKLTDAELAALVQYLKELDTKAPAAGGK